MTAILNLNTKELNFLKDYISTKLLKKTSNVFEILLNESVNYRIRKIDNLNFSEFENLITPSDEKTQLYAVYVKCDGDIHLELLYTFHRIDAEKIASKLLGKKITTFSQLEKSTLTEIGNILSGSLFNVISNSKDFEINSSVPGFADENLMALLDTLMINFADVGDSVMSIDVEFRTESGILLNILILLDHIEARKLIENKSDS
jgi:chemotaxis protein CheC